MLSGLIEFRRRFRGRYWLEVLAVNAYTDFESELDALRACVTRIGPDRVLLNTVTRPPAEDYAGAVPGERLWKMAASFSPPAEIMDELHEWNAASQTGANRNDILGLLARRPCTVDDIVAGLQMQHDRSAENRRTTGGRRAD